MASDSVIKVSGLSSRKVDLGLLGSSFVSSKLQIRATAGALGFSVTENMATITKKELIGTKLFERWQKKKNTWYWRNMLSRDFSERVVIHN